MIKVKIGTMAIYERRQIYERRRIRWNDQLRRVRDDAQVLGEAFMWVTLTLIQVENMSEASLDGQRMRSALGMLRMKCL